MPLPPPITVCVIFALLFTERTRDKAHPHKEPNVSVPAHLHFRPEPPQRAGGRETCSDVQERGESRLALKCPSCVRARFIETTCKITSSCVWDFQGAAAKKQAKKNKTEDVKQTDTAGEEKNVEEEEIPQLVPIATPNKKPKLEVSATPSS